MILAWIRLLDLGVQLSYFYSSLNLKQLSNQKEAYVWPVSC